MKHTNPKRTIILYVTLLVSIILLAVMWQLNRYVAGLPPMPKIANYQVNKVTLTDKTDGAKIKPNDLVPSCPGLDCLKSLDQPRLEATTTANYWLKDDDRIIGLVYQGIARAYPEKILSYHSVVNDLFQLQPIIITFSPLTGSSAAYQPVVNGINTQFGVSGLVHQSDIVLYDRLQGNLWEQMTGQAILGPAAQANETLKSLPLSFTSWKVWRQAHPDTQVLSKATNLPFDYEKSPYQEYQTNEELRFNTVSNNKALPTKELVYGLVLGTVSKAYPDKLITTKPLIDRLGNVNITIVRQADGTVVATNTETKELSYPQPTFWFAWAAFYPQTLVYRQR